MPGEPYRSPRGLEAHQDLWRLRNRARTRLPRPRRIGRGPQCDTRHPLRRSLGWRESLLVRQAELPWAGIDSRPTAGWAAVDWVQWRQAPSRRRAAHRVLGHGFVERPDTRKPRHRFYGSRAHPGLLRRANRRHYLQSGRGLCCGGSAWLSYRAGGEPNAYEVRLGRGCDHSEDEIAAGGGAVVSSHPRPPPRYHRPGYPCRSGCHGRNSNLLNRRRLPGGGDSTPASGLLIGVETKRPGSPRASMSPF